MTFDDGVFSRFFRILRPGELDFSIEFVMRFTVGNGFTFTRVRFVARIRLGVLFGNFLPLANFGLKVLRLLSFFNRILNFVPVMAGLISCLRVIIRQGFTISLTFQDLLRCLYLHLFSTTFLIVKIFGIFCSPRFKCLAAEKDGDKQLSRQFVYFLGVCLLCLASNRSVGAGDSTVLRRFTVSVGRARAELRQFVVLLDFRRASSAELRQYLA